MTLSSSASPSPADHTAPVKPAVAPPAPADAMPKWPTYVWAHKWRSLFGIIVVLAVIYMIYRYFQGAAVPVDVVRRANLVETVVASGHVESPFRVDIASQITGTVASVVVHEGETVRKGQPLILLEADELQSAASEAQAAVTRAKAHIRQLSELSLPQAIESQKSAASNLGTTEKIFSRATALVNQGYVTRAYFDDAKKNRDIAHAQVATAAAQVRSARVGGSDFATAQADLAQAKSGASAATSRLTYSTISAPRAGTLISRAVERGTVVTPGTPLMILSPENSTQIILQIDERNLGKIAIGQPAIVSADAYPKQRFSANIIFINPGVDIARASVTVKLSVPKPPTYLREDMTVSVDIETARRNAVLILPSGSIHGAYSSLPWLMTLENGRAVRRNVRLGLHGNKQIEIVDGVKSGTIVISAASKIEIGDRAKAAIKTAAK
jgi:HlyD family secretion protein